MIVVVIIGVLATLAMYGTKRYITSSKTGEAVQFIGTIKAAEETYKDETFQYLKVSDSLTDFYPKSPHRGQYKVQWGGEPQASLDKWTMLGVHPSGPVWFVYACTAGGAEDAIAAPGDGITVTNWPSGTQGAPWYVVKAVADLDESGPETVYVSANFSNQIFSANEGD